ncbi:MAG: Si-specific NAD(P)(+) transhydrogenase [Candidatus Dadabacteria bacterium]|nr:MAG: Si-specific NAD(P)(+) transhydrogenase [Candidatus Dadabacteria bacterium]
MSEKYDYDLIVIGSGPGGQKAAIQAVKLGKRVAVVDMNPRVGGVCLHNGTIPSKSFREAILHLTGYRERFHYGKAYRVKQHITMQDLTARCEGIVRDIEQTMRSQMQRNHVDIIEGYGSFIDNHHIKVRKNNKEEVFSTEFVCIATGTRPWHPPKFDFDGDVILDSNSILEMKELPRSLCVVGGGVIGSEYGSMFAALGIRVTIVEARESILGFVDKELIDSLQYKLREQKVAIITNDKVVRCSKAPDGRAVTYLESGKRIVTEKLLVSAGRVGNVERLDLQNIGLEADQRGRIKVNDHYQTDVENVYAVGDIIGFPALASTALEQGRRAACHAFGLYDRGAELPLPFGIYTVPEIGMVGKTEKELSEAKVPYETGIARFSEIERGKIIGEDSGVLKILFHRGTLQLLGVHIIGENATELVHIGQTVMGFQGGIDYLVQSIFNYPTLSQAYRTAALDGLNKVIATEGLPDEDPYMDLVAEELN